MLEGDDDAHVVMRDRVTSLSTVLLAVRFSEAARDRAGSAEVALIKARCRAEEARLALHDTDDVRAARLHADEAEHEVVRLTIQAAQALEYLMRATETLERAIRLCAMGRS